MKTYTKKNEKTIKPYVAKAIKDYLIKAFKEDDGYEFDENIPIETVCNSMFVAEYGEPYVIYAAHCYPFCIQALYDFELDHLVLTKADFRLSKDKPEQIVGLYSTRRKTT